ncbi:threonine--tRNA ligase [Patescibacteria group bacterium]|nr:threonine--tRNA ligase [Patescibacteria group bacterium]MBU1256144.1 threonine--tRNA ligase [Patescibacteria group bacterium]MBU1457249.1 threonine--tRNA ligase [Patescibacteria group bacterium]
MKSDKLKSLRHTAEHVLMQAMDELFPGKIIKAMGPATDHGFYFDFETTNDFKISELDFEAIEKKMQTIIDQNIPLTKKKITPQQAKKIFKQNPYKLEWIKEAEDRGDPLTVYYTGTFVDLCSGPHVKSTGEIKAFKLLSVAGAYWRGSEKNKMLTRIYGTAFENQKELTTYIHNLEEAKKRDHRKLGKSLDLFSFSDLVGSGLPLYSPKGALLRRLVNQHVEEVQSSQEYLQVWTPQIAKAELFKTSGHYDKYKGDMFRVVSNYSDEEFFLKPMNCPQHTQIYASQPRSYKDLPLRYTDFAMLYRDEKPGELSGLARVRSFSQDDCHVFCRLDQVDQEVDTMLTMTKEIMATYGFKYRYRLSTRDKSQPEKYIGDPKTWDKVEKWAEKIMKRNHIDYYDSPGEAAFYAPKMDLMATDALGREWQLSTVQIDLFAPERFKLTYTDSDGQEKRPVMLHRAIIGSPERFLMILIEHFAGAFPIWLSPVQVAILPISEKFITQAEKIYKKLTDQGIRVELDTSNESLGKKIRNAETQKTPYMLILGQKEIDQDLVSIRQRGQKDLGQMTLALFSAKIQQEITDKLIF